MRTRATVGPIVARLRHAQTQSHALAPSTALAQAELIVDRFLAADRAVDVQASGADVVAAAWHVVGFHVAAVPAAVVAAGAIARKSGVWSPTLVGAFESGKGPTKVGTLNAFCQ
jgi:hypothetical protein